MLKLFEHARRKDPERLDVYLHGLEGTTKFERSLMGKLDEVLNRLLSLEGKVNFMGAQQDRFNTELEELRTEVAAVGTRFTAVLAELRAAIESGNETALGAAADQLDTLTTQLRTVTTKPE